MRSGRAITLFTSSSNKKNSGTVALLPRLPIEKSHLLSSGLAENGAETLPSELNGFFIAAKALAFGDNGKHMVSIHIHDGLKVRDNY